jgi:hypothetical protein
MSKKRRCVVIDADVLLAAGGENAVYPKSVHCRDSLDAVLKICHRVIAPQTIRDEWDRKYDQEMRRPGRFGTDWRKQMMSKKKLDVCNPAPLNQTLRDQIAGLTLKKSDKRILMKDVHLVEAALLADKIIFSCDEECRRLFALASRQIGDLGTLIWINPDSDAEECREWLKRGAPYDKRKTLKQFALELQNPTESPS